MDLPGYWSSLCEPLPDHSHPTKIPQQTNRDKIQGKYCTLLAQLIKNDKN